MHELLRCNINASVHARARGADMSLRDVTIAQIGNRDRECEWRHAPEACGGFCEFWRKLVELSSASGEDGWLSLVRRGLGQVSHEVGGRWKIQNRKNVYLSPYIEEPLNSKVIKSFVPELRSRKCFSCFGIPMFYVYMLWTFHVRFAYPYGNYSRMLEATPNKTEVVHSLAIRLTKYSKYW